MSRVNPVFPLWARVLMVCATLLCLAGLARPAMAMPSGMETMAMSAMSGAEADGTAMSVAGPAAVRDACPTGQQHCAQPAAPMPTTAAVPAVADTPSVTQSSPQLWAARSGALPQCGPEPPDLHRLCVSRT